MNNRRKREPGEAVGIWWQDEPEFHAVHGHVDEDTFAASCAAEGVDRARFGAISHEWARWVFADESLRSDGCDRMYRRVMARSRGAFPVTYAEPEPGARGRG